MVRYGILKKKRGDAMNISELFLQLYNAGILAMAIMALAIALIAYPTLRKHTGKKK